MISPAWMGKRDNPGVTLPPASDRFGHSSLALAKVPNLRGSADQYGQFKIGHCAENAVSPGLSAHSRRWQVSAGVTVSRKTERHGKDRETTPVVELYRRHPEPCPQPISGRVRKRSSQPMDSRPRRLTCDENRRCRRQPRNRPGTVCGGSLLKHRLAQPAGTDFVFESFDRTTHATQFPRIGPLFQRRKMLLAAGGQIRNEVACTRDKRRQHGTREVAPFVTS